MRLAVRRRNGYNIRVTSRIAVQLTRAGCLVTSSDRVCGTVAEINERGAPAARRLPRSVGET